MNASIQQRIIDAAVASLIDQGTARTTTMEVQRRAGVSRGALLHYYPTLASLLSATVEELVRRNEQAVNDGLAELEGTTDAIERAVRVLARTTSSPSYLAELELWAVSRTDPELHEALVAAERRASKESARVVKALFSATKDRPAQATVMALTVEFLRGLALSGVLRGSAARRQQLIAQWIRSVEILLETLP